MSKFEQHRVFTMPTVFLQLICQKHIINISLAFSITVYCSLSYSRSCCDTYRFARFLPTHSSVRRSNTGVCTALVCHLATCTTIHTHILIHGQFRVDSCFGQWVEDGKKNMRTPQKERTSVTTRGSNQ